MERQKSIFFFILFLLVSSISLTHATNYEEELKKAKKDNKPVILYFYSRHCPYCDLMERNVILDKTVKKILDNTTVFVWIDAEKRKDLMKNYEVWGFPTLVLLEPSGKMIASVPGYVHKERFLKILEYLRDGHYKKVPLRKYLTEQRS